MAGSRSRLYFFTIASNETLLAVVSELNTLNVVRDGVFALGHCHHLVSRDKEKLRHLGRQTF